MMQRPKGHDTARNWAGQRIFYNEENEKKKKKITIIIFISTKMT